MDEEQRKNKIISLIKNHECITSNKKRIAISKPWAIAFLLFILLLLSFGHYQAFQRRAHISNLEFKIADLELKLKKYLKQNGTDVDGYKAEFIKLNYKNKRISNDEIRIKATLENEGDSDLSSTKLVALCFSNNHLEMSQIIDAGSLGKNQNKKFDFKVNCMPHQRYYIFVSEIEFAEASKLSPELSIELDMSAG